jgi:hypothetical protein
LGVIQDMHLDDTYKGREVFFPRAEGGRFVDFWALEDGVGRLRQLGLISSPKRSR